MGSDPFEYLGNAGNHINTWILVFGPLGVVSFFVILLAIWVRVRRKRERKELETDFKELGGKQDQQTVEEISGLDLPVSREPVPVSEPDEIREIRAQDQASWLIQLRRGLTRTREAIEGGFRSIFAGSTKLDDATLEKLHELLYRADVGVKTADRLIDGLRTSLGGRDVAWPEVQSSLADQAKQIFLEAEKPLATAASGPFVILVVGVNGVGKTTTIGKLAARYKAAGKNVMLCAADTFRAAAIDQLQVWGDRLEVPVIKQHPGADPAAVAFDGVQAAKARNVDILIIDTAGRLHSKTELMAELGKVNKSIGKDLAGAPHETWLVLDATTGQNAVQQCKAFNEVTALTGLVMTKLDGTAKGGVILGIADQFKLPIRYIGVGEKAADLREFSGIEFVKGLLGLA